ncbi:TadE/TadG family type IV pilus assembly protein [Leptothrix sp. BB-4]
MSAPRRQVRSRGVATIEFAIVLIFVFTLLFAMLEVGRLVWTWNVAVAATRDGARWAALYEPAAANQVRNHVERFSLGAIKAANVDVEYLDPETPGVPCSVDNCKFVRVSLNGATFTSVVSIVPLSVRLPAFPATARREAMSAAPL